MNCDDQNRKNYQDAYEQKKRNLQPVNDVSDGLATRVVVSAGNLIEVPVG